MPSVYRQIHLFFGFVGLEVDAFTAASNYFFLLLIATTAAVTAINTTIAVIL